MSKPLIPNTIKDVGHMLYVNNKAVGYTTSPVRCTFHQDLDYKYHKLDQETGMVKLGFETGNTSYDVKIPKKALRELMLGLI
jgi:hypothetical protein